MTRSEIRSLAVLGFVSSYLKREDTEFILRGGYTVTYLPYDWTLNDRHGDG